MDYTTQLADIIVLLKNLYELLFVVVYMGFLITGALCAGFFLNQWRGIS